MADQPTLDRDLYSYATLRVEEHARQRIDGAVDSEGLARWFGDQLRHAYTAGLRDGYVQGRHDRHNDPNERETLTREKEGKQ